jgi:hypothetical protein
MSATPPEASSEYSRAFPPSRALLGIGARVPAAVLGAAILGALLLVVAEFTTLFDIHVSTSSSPIKSIGTGPHHSYALIPIALFAVVLAYGARRHGSRPALLALGVVGVVALIIALAGDLPDAHASGLISQGNVYTDGTARPAVGLYLETAGAALLLMASALGFLLGAAPKSRVPG